MAAQFAVRFTLIAFAVAELRGMLLGADFTTATGNALWAGCLCFVPALLAGHLAARLVEESARREFDQKMTPSTHHPSTSPASVAEDR